ncbi:MAG TPA: MATE family efflux transporter [Henriciella marina]|uniref:MATE family efflux transporter n=1 Tax=Henriciella sp. TaxID=1968823 RepID=UPI0017CB73B2|nr:MATE family efflux transporter [Henriciella sp.]HIG23912.1 MATE family efflux transporter [Henriciella sp.]HIK66017.1 MATE family efflux transporter [Henriciella marina]
MRTDQRAQALLEGPIIKSLLKLAVPIIIANVLQSAYQLIDAFWVGRLGEAAVAAVSVSFPVIFLTIALGSGLGIAGSILVAQYYGADDQDMVNHVAAQTILSIIVTSLILGAAGFAMTSQLLRMMGVTQDVFDGAKGFMNVAFLGLAFSFTFIMFQSLMRGVGEVNLPIYIVGGTVALNAVLDPLFIFGWGPVPASGVMGAAMATFATQGIACFIGLWVMFGGRFGMQIRWRDFRPDFDFIKKAFFLGLPASIEMSARAFGIIIMTFLIASFGTLAIASYGVGTTILQVVMIPALGLSMAISTLVGQNIGAGQKDRAEKIGRLGALISFGALTVAGVTVFAFAPAFIAFFVPGEEEVIATGSIFLRTMALAWGFLGAQFALTGVLRASGNMMIAMMLTLVSQWVIQFPLAYVLSMHSELGMNGIWWAFPVTHVTIALITVVIFLKGDWKNKQLTGGPEDRLASKVSEEILSEEAYTRRQG